MSKRSISNKEPKFLQTDNLKNKNTDQLIEMVAEQFASLLWKQWMAKKNNHNHF